MGYLRVGERSGLACARPLLVVCRVCDGRTAWRCDTYGCGPCGEQKRRRLERLIEDGAGKHLENGLHGYFATFTAPGERDHSVWVQGSQFKGGKLDRRPCSCHRHGLTDGAWNKRESACWNRLRTSIARDRTVAFAGAVEVQKRGMLHRHVVLMTDTALSFEEVQSWALSAGYGCLADLQPLLSARSVSRYLSKYVTKSASGRGEVHWTVEHLDRETGELTERSVPATYRLWSSSRAWGVTMAEIRSVAREQARRRAVALREVVVDEAGAEAGQQLVTASADP